ncbi:MAG: preprotein translocase subunit SecG, partial [Verrucomicrobiota bacterium]|nr:preprotein translocase subunit SecG [Verrucomicrobiota bacterium]
FGARTGNVLTKATVGIGIVFLVNTLILGMLFAGSSGASLMDDAVTTQPAPIEQPAMPEVPAAPAE